MKHMILNDIKNINNNAIVLGRTDSEKETLTKYEIFKALDEGKEVVVFDFNDRYTHLSDLLKGNLITINEGQTINPLAFVNFEQEKEEEGEYPNVVHQALQVRYILTTLLQLNKEEEKEMWEVLVRLYKSKGIVQHMKTRPTNFPTLQELAEFYPTKRETILALAAYFSNEKTTYQHLSSPSKRLTILSFAEVDDTIKAGLIQTYLNYYSFHLPHMKNAYRVFIDDIAPFTCPSFLQSIERLVHHTRYNGVKGIQLDTSNFQTLIEHSRVYSFCDSIMILNIETNDFEFFCNFINTSDTSRYDYLLRQNNPLAYILIGGCEQIRHMADVLLEVEKVEHYLQKKRRIHLLKDLQGAVTRVRFEFKQLIGKELAYLIDGYDVEHFFLINRHEKIFTIETKE